MDLSVIIVNWNTRDMLAQCLEAAIGHLGDLDCEMIVVDNGSSDGSPQIVTERYPQVRLIGNTENLGFARANNQAIQSSQGRYVLLLNSDAFLVDDSIGRILALLDANPRVAIAGPRLVYPDGSPQVSHGPLPTLTREMLSLLGLDKLLSIEKANRAGNTPYVETGTVEGASLLARRAALDQFGVFDEGFYFFSEEVDLCYRAHQAGWQVVYIPDTQVVHMQGGSSGVVPRRVLLLYRGKLQYFGKHYGSAAQRRLYWVMRIATGIKVFLYTLLRLSGLDLNHKDALWREVGNGLRAIPGM